MFSKNYCSFYIASFTLVLLISHSCDSANILIFVILCSLSQLNVHHPYAVRLVEAGHNVTMIMPMEYKSPHPKINYFIPEELKREYETNVHGFHEAVVQLRADDIASGSTLNVGFDTLPDQGVVFCKIFLNSANVVDKLENSKFDLVIIDDLWNDCALGLAYKFKAPHIYFATAPVMPSSYDTFGVVPENSWSTDVRRRHPVSGELNFLQRVQNVLSMLEMHFVFKHFSGYFEELEELLKSKLNIPDMPPLAQMERDASLVFVNSHFSIEVARSLPPFFIEVGGLQCDGKGKTQILPKDIADFVAKFPKGFLYMSFGTVVDLPADKQNTFLQVFSEFSNIGFVMKWQGEKPKKIPNNVFLVSYAPQQALLAHPKIIAFISHGGMLSTQEVVYYGVPVIGLPVFAEQDYNVNNLQRLGAALKLEITALTREVVHSAIYRMVNDPRYRQSMQRITKLSKDRPQHPMDTTIWWIEYILRHSKDGTGLNHLKPLGIHQTWFQRRCLDVWAFILFSALILSYLSMKILSLAARLVLNCLFRKGKLE